MLLVLFVFVLFCFCSFYFIRFCSYLFWFIGLDGENSKRLSRERIGSSHMLMYQWGCGKEVTCMLDEAVLLYLFCSQKLCYRSRKKWWCEMDVQEESLTTLGYFIFFDWKSKCQMEVKEESLTTFGYSIFFGRRKLVLSQPKQSKCQMEVKEEW